MGGKAKRLFLSPLRQAYSSTLLVCTCSFQNMLTLRWSSEPKLSGVDVVWVMRFCEIESFRSFGQWALGSASLRHLDPMAAATAPPHGTSTQCLDVFGVFDEICRIGCWRNSVSIYFNNTGGLSTFFNLKSRCQLPECIWLLKMKAALPSLAGSWVA